MDLNQQVTITLPLGAWNTVLGLIAKGPWEMADPLMQIIRTQITSAQHQPPRLVETKEAG